MRKWMIPGLLLCLVAALASLAGATEYTPAPLGYEELLVWREGFAMQAREQPVLNRPEDTYNPDVSSGYLIEVEDGTISASAPSVSAAADITGAEWSAGQTPCPRGLSIGSSLESVLLAYPNQNPGQKGDEARAVLYAYDAGGYEGQAGALYGVLYREGTLPVAVQYTVMEPTDTGEYQELGIQYILTDGYVSAIRVYGYDTLISEAEMSGVMEDIHAAAELDTLDAQAAGASSEILMLADLRFEGLYLPALTQEELRAQLGAPEQEEEAPGEEGEGTAVVLTYPGRVFEFENGPQGQRFSSFTLDDESAEGPRGVRVGQELSDVLRSFRLEDAPWDGTRVLLYAYGETTETPPFGMLEYYSDREATLRYAVMDDDGSAWMMHISIADLKVDEVLIYRYAP